MYEFGFDVGQRVRITHRVPRLSGTLTSVVEGEVVSYGQSKTGSWFAHSKDKKLWLDRVELRKDDGEIVVVNLDRFTTVEPTPGGDGRGDGAGAASADAGAGASG